MTRRSIDLGAFGRTFATRDRAREVAKAALNCQSDDPYEMVLDLKSVGLASPAFLDEFIGAMADMWPSAALVVAGPERLVEVAIALAERRGLRASTREDAG